MIYLSAELHLNHNQPFIYETRGFNTVGEMNKAIIKNFNSIITWEDDLYLLGDCFLGDLNEGLKLFNQLPGKIHLIWGNHDTDTRKVALAQCHNVIEVIGFAGILKYRKYHFYISHYPTATTNFNDCEKPLKGRILSISGHTHSMDKFEPCGSYNVAIEAHGCCPVSIEQIINDFKDKNK
jgi:calcineurin-like phosphoesterase family protein